MALLATCLCLHSTAVFAQSTPAEPRVPCGKALSEAGTLLAREDDGQPWKPVAQVFTRDHLLALAGLKAVIEPAPETVRLTLWGNLPPQSPFPVLESSAVLHDSKAYDLDITLQAGRAVVTNTKKTTESTTIDTEKVQRLFFQ